MLIFIVLVLLILVLVNLTISKGDWFSPGVIFNLTFLISALACIFFSDMYKLEFHYQTLLVVTAGGLIFTVFSFIFEKMGTGYRKSVMEDDSNRYIYVSTLLTAIMTVLLILYSIQMVQYVIRVASRYGGGSLQTSIGIYNYYTKFTDELVTSPVRKDFFAAKMGVPCTCYLYLILYVFLYNIVNSKRFSKLQFAYIVIFFLSGFVTGSRTSGVRVITAAIMLVVFFSNRRKSRRRLPLKSLFKIALVIIIVAVLFFVMRSVIGRSTSKPILYVVFPYLGGPLANLDSYLQGRIHTSTIWGQQTFANAINNIGGYLNNNKLRYMLDVPFLTMNGLNTGNVYTMYYMFICDFGYEGVVPLTTVIAVYYCYTYKKIKVSGRRFKKLDLRTVVYVYLFNDLVMLMFSNRFYETAFRIIFVKYLIGFVILRYIMLHFDYHKGIRFRRKNI